LVVIGIDAHKRTHTAVIVDRTGRELAVKTVGTTSSDHLALLRWATAHAADRAWAIEDCRHLSRRLERDLIAAGEQVVRGPLKLVANVRTSARTYGKSNPIDALAVARAALRKPNLPVARLDGAEREIRCWSSTVKTWLPSAPASSDDCAGICTNSTPAGIHRPNSTGPARSPGSTRTWYGDQPWLVPTCAALFVLTLFKLLEILASLGCAIRRE
jgi:Transposase